MAGNEYKVKLVKPPYDSEVVDLVVSLNNLRDKQLHGSTHPSLFFQVKNLFQIVESIESARIEGNHTTLADYVVKRIQKPTERMGEHFQEIRNIEQAMEFIENYFSKNGLDAPINRILISQIHKAVVNNLKNGSYKSPGEYRMENVRISKSKHQPPDYLQVPNYMEPLIDFINAIDKPKYDLLKTAAAHHWFTWIHPFSDGNGRTVRLLTYAMLIKQGFNITAGRILNPTAIFCTNRDSYYEKLSDADSGTEEGLLAWYEYMLSGLNAEIQKIDQLLVFDFLTKNILLPALKECFEVKKILTAEQYKWLSLTMTARKKQTVKAADFKLLTPNDSSLTITRKINKLKKQGLLKSPSSSSRTYHLDLLNNSDLTSSIIHQLHENEFVPKNL